MAQASLKVATAADQRIRALGNTMFELNAAGGCTRQLLLAEGFSEHELETYGEAVRQLANRRFVRRLEEDRPDWTEEDVVAVAIDRCGGLLGTASITSALRQAHIPNAVIARHWDVVIAKLAAQVVALPSPRLATEPA